MFINYYIYILFIPMMFISILLTLISNSWMALWMLMELSLLSLILLMMFDKTIQYELLMKYYLFQSLQSYIFLINSLGLFLNNFMYNSIIIMNFCMLMKLSLFPFHLWYIKILNKLNWINIYYFSIISKIIPLLILNNIINYNYNYLFYLNYMLMLISSFFSALIALNQTNIKILMGYSSMIQLSWLIIIMHFNELLSLIYFMIYNLIMMNLFFSFKFINLNSLIQLNSLKMMKNMLLINSLMMLSLSGLPPFFGFLMKWLGIEFMVNLNFKFYFMMMYIFNSLISMFFYIRIIFIFLMNYYMINKNFFKFININNLMNYKYIYLIWFTFTLILMYQMI